MIIIIIICSKVKKGLQYSKQGIEISGLETIFKTVQITAPGVVSRLAHDWI